jgi:transposase
MAYREFGMVEVREILRRWLGGTGIRAIARAAGVDRKTIAAYVQAAVAVGVQRGSAPPTDVQIAAIATARRPGRPPNSSAPSPELEVLRPHEGTVRQWLTEGWRLTKIYRRLRAAGVRVSYSSLYRFARSTCEFATPAITVRVADPPPGEVAETDCGLLGYWLDPTTTRRRRVYGLLVTLCFSRYAFLAISLRQDLGAVLEGLEAAWAFFDGVVRRLVVDNLTPAVTRPDRYTPGLNRVFLEYAQYRGFVVDPAVPDHPTGKRQASYCSSFLHVRRTLGIAAAVTKTFARVGARQRADRRLEQNAAGIIGALAAEHAFSGEALGGGVMHAELGGDLLTREPSRRAEVLGQARDRVRLPDHAHQSPRE